MMIQIEEMRCILRYKLNLDKKMKIYLWVQIKIEKAHMIYIIKK